MVNKLVRDLDLAHRRRWPGRPVSLVSRALLLAGSPGLRLMLIHRIAHWLHLKEAGGKHARLWRLIRIPSSLLKWVIQVSTKSFILNDSEIEGGVSFSNEGHIIFGATRTGAGTVIGMRTTVGMNPIDGGSPEIGRNVWIGSDCVVFGLIRIGDGATLLPGSVLAKSIPAGVVMQGNPARLVMLNFDNSALRERQDVDALALVTSVREA